MSVFKQVTLMLEKKIRKMHLYDKWYKYLSINVEYEKFPVFSPVKKPFWSEQTAKMWNFGHWTLDFDAVKLPIHTFRQPWVLDRKMEQV